jgi:hypothetical protein
MPARVANCACASLGFEGGIRIEEIKGVYQIIISRSSTTWMPARVGNCACGSPVF